MVADPLQALAHDHRELGGLLVAVHEALARVERGQSSLEDELHEIGDGTEALRDALLEHFAREQEALMPFVLTRFPAERERIGRIMLEHDRIAEALTALVKDVVRLDAARLPSWRASLEEFEELYASHTRAELAFLGEVAASLSNDHAAAEQLRALLEA